MSRHRALRHLLSTAIAAFVGGGLYAGPAEAQITKAELETIAAHFHAEYDQELAASNQSFFINRSPNPAMQDFWWNQKLRRAAYASFTFESTKHREHYIFFFGGFAEIPGLTVDAAVLTICHELGHGLGGPPYKDPHDGQRAVSIEAVADDYAARVCLKRMFARIPPPRQAPPLASSNTAMIEKICEKRVISENPDDIKTCRRAMAAFEFDRMYFKTDPNILEDSSFLDRDASVAKSVITTPAHYPSAQCRIDTMLAGFFDEARPNCWWPLQTVN